MVSFHCYGFLLLIKFVLPVYPGAVLLAGFAGTNPVWFRYQSNRIDYGMHSIPSRLE